MLDRTHHEIRSSGLSADVPTLDSETIEELLDLDEGEGDLLSALIEEFIPQAEQRIEQLTALGHTDLEQSRAIAHTLKGSAGSIGAARLSALACAAQRSAEQGDPNGLGSAVNAMSGELPHVRQAFAKYA